MNAPFERWTGLHLLEPAFLLLALLVPLVLFLRRRPAAAVAFAPAHLLGRSTSWRTALAWLPSLAQGLGLVLLAVALARPAARTDVGERGEGIDILLCLDTSSSMTATDMDPSRTRLDLARDAAIRFVDGRGDDRIGLVAFARYPDVRCPLTLDHRALVRLLYDVEAVDRDGPEDATGIGTAAARAAEILSRGDASSKVAIVLTDGEENVALEGKEGEIPPSHAAQLAARLGIRVYVVVFQPQDTRALEQLAVSTGGALFTARDADAASRVWAEIDALERAPVRAPRYVFEDRYLAFLVAALALLLLGVFLGSTVLEVLP